ncbi:MAG: SUMF1/EgtB/PvdO family nonheme iron enzyme [Geminicoccaceae bacterium]
MRTHSFLSYGALLLLICCVASPSIAAERVALVIGNSAYVSSGVLETPSNDALVVGDTLTDVGFDVELGFDLSQQAMETALRDFTERARTADAALIYFAGLGLQFGGQNYVLATDAELNSRDDLATQAVPVDSLLKGVAKAEKAGIVILDASRPNPLADGLRDTLGPDGAILLPPGMGAIDNIPNDTLVAFPTRFNSVVRDDDSKLGRYTQALARHVGEPGLELTFLFRKIRHTVLEFSVNQQEPQTLDNLGIEPFYFADPARNRSPEMGLIRPMTVADNVGSVEVDITEPIDPDGDPLSVKIRGLPAVGVLDYEDEPLEVGKVLTVGQLQQLSYSPEQGEIGDAGTFSFSVQDGQGGYATGHVPITIILPNRAPVVRDLVSPAIPLGIASPVDPDGDVLMIDVLTVPTIGEIKDGERTVQIGDRLTVEALTALTLDVKDGAAGEFAYEVSDGKGGMSGAVLRVDAFGRGLSAPAQETADSPAADNPANEVAPPDEAVMAAAEEADFLVTSSNSNIRKKADIKGTWLTSVPAGTVLKRLAKADDADWFEVETISGQKGFISAALVEPRGTLGGATLATGGPAATTDGTREITIAALDGKPDFLSPFSECDHCPTMIAAPPGRFIMGSDDGEASELPTREIVIDTPFAIGKFEITAAEWQACVDAEACPEVAHLAPEDRNKPIKNISVPDALAYLEWLSSVTGKSYRLPTEAEWEYAARGGTTTTYWWGNDNQEGSANCADCGEPWDRKQPEPVGSYDANPFGLHDVNGGVSEWVSDCWFEDYAKAPGDARARVVPGCRQQALRGGSWKNKASDITSSRRISYDARVRYYTNGFRAARDLD